MEHTYFMWCRSHFSCAVAVQSSISFLLFLLCCMVPVMLGQTTNSSLYTLWPFLFMIWYLEFLIHLFCILFCKLAVIEFNFIQASFNHSLNLILISLLFRPSVTFSSVYLLNNNSYFLENSDPGNNQWKNLGLYRPRVLLVWMVSSWLNGNTIIRDWFPVIPI